MVRSTGYPFILFIVSVAGVGLFLGSMASAHSGGDGSSSDFDTMVPRKVSPEAAKFIGLTTAEVARKTIHEVIETVGVVKAMPDRTYLASPRFPGTILKITKNAGDSVKAGDLLAQISSAEVARTEADIQRLTLEREKLLLEREKTREEVLTIEQGLRYFKSQVETTQKEYDRLSELKKSGAPAIDLAAREATLLHDRELLKIKSRELEMSQGMIDLYLNQAESIGKYIFALKSLFLADVSKQDTNVLELKAPFDGVVVSRTGSPGQWIQSGQLLEVDDFSVVNVAADLPESLAARIRERKSDKATVSVLSGGSWHGAGTLRSVICAVDPRKRTFQIVVEVPNPDGVLFGEMAVNLCLESSEIKQVLAVPVSAVISEGPARYVFVESGGQYQRQDVVPGAKDNQFIEIKEGLAPGDIVVASGAAALALMPGNGRN